MTRHRTARLLLPLLGLGMSLAIAATAHAQDHNTTSASLQIQFGSPRHWMGITGTKVEEMPAAERPGYDMYRYSGNYYAYDNNHWYMSAHENGDYTPIDDGAVPSDFAAIPRDHWQHYPATWQDRNDQPVSRMSASLHVQYGNSPHWTAIAGTNVDEINSTERPDYDVFRYGGSYYAYQNNQWYRSAQETGDFTAIEDASVPTDFTSIPREHWRNYPSSWRERHDQVMGAAAARLQVRFGTAPHWSSIEGTHVDEITAAERPDYDMFRYSGHYYAYDNNQWYMSANESGDFMAIDGATVPAEFSGIPREHWRNYPTAWWDRHNRGADGSSATLQVNFGSRPRWNGITGTHVREIRQGERPDYDMFRYGGSYYAYNNNRWYMSRRASGQFSRIDDRAVPAAFRTIPRDHWRNYPAGWLDANGNPRRVSSNQGRSSYRDK